VVKPEVSATFAVCQLSLEACHSDEGGFLTLLGLGLGLVLEG